MRRRLRLFMLLLIALVPVSAVKRFLYRFCFGYLIDGGTRIGFCLLDATQVFIGKNCRLHSFVVVRRVREFRLGDNVTVGPVNLFTTAIAADEYQYNFRAGDGAYLSRSHRYDMSADITIGDETIVGGVSGALWTHGAWREHAPVTIGKKCFIGDAAQILPGVRLAENTLVANGAVVSPREYPPDCILLGNPARVTQTGYVWWRDAKPKEA